MEINLTLVGEIITFVVFVWFTMKFIWPPLMKAIEERQKTIADGLAAGERGEHALELAKKKSSELIHDAKTESSQMMDGANAKANKIFDKAKSEGRVEANKIIENALKETERNIAHAKTALQKDTVKIAVSIAEKIMQKSIDKNVHDKMIEELIEQI